MFLVNVVDDALSDQVRKIPGLEYEHAVWPQQTSNTLDEVVQVIHVRKHVVRGDNRRRSAIAPELVGQCRGEERVHRLETGVGRFPRHVARRIDAEHAHAAIPERAQQRTVVAADVDDQRLRRNARAREDRFGVAIEVLNEPEGNGGVVNVVPVQDFGIHDVGQLGETAAPAHHHGHRIHRLRHVQRSGGDVMIAGRRGCELQYDGKIGAVAHPARAAMHHRRSHRLHRRFRL